ncbi:MAG: thiamine pyrophosphate-binding protein [Aggregatilineales bacterium]
MFVLGGELIARALKAQGVDRLYTLCGGHILPIYEGCLNNGIKVIDFRHEQAAAHAADAYARLTHNVGVAAVTAGPGVTDAVTGVANAYQARSPMILLGGAAPLKTRGRGALQEIPQTQMFETFTKASFTVERTEDFPQLMHDAIKTALSGRPGPVFMEVPFDILFNAIDDPGELRPVTIEPIEPEVGAMGRIFEILRNAKSPLIVAGTQVYWDKGHDALRELTEQTGIPVYTNGGGRGTLSMEHPNLFKASRGRALYKADAVVLIGTPLDFRLKYGLEGWNKDAKLIQIENDVDELNHNREADVALVADSRLVLEALSEGLQGVRYDEWLDEVRGYEARKNDDMQEWMQWDDQPINHFRFAAEIQNFINEDTIIIGDGGDIVSACAKVINVTRPGQWLDPGPLGCLGVGAPFAVAAQDLFPDKRVLIINGDGSFGLNGFEFDTAVRFGLPIVSIVGNDSGWGQIRGPQIGMVTEERAIATALAPTRYDKIVEAMGGHGELVEDPAQIVPALERAFASGKPACINVTLDPTGMAKTGASTPYVT